MKAFKNHLRSFLLRPRSSVRLEYWPFKPGVAGSNPVGAMILFVQNRDVVDIQGL